MDKEKKIARPVRADNEASAWQKRLVWTNVVSTVFALAAIIVSVVSIVLTLQ